MLYRFLDNSKSIIVAKIFYALCTEFCTKCSNYIFAGGLILLHDDTHFGASHKYEYTICYSKYTKSRERDKERKRRAAPASSISF